MKILIFLYFCIYPLWINAQILDSQNKSSFPAEEITQAQKEPERQKTVTSLNSKSEMDSYRNLLEELGLEIKIIEDLEESINDTIASTSNTRIEESIYISDFHRSIDQFLLDIFPSIQTEEEILYNQLGWFSIEGFIVGINMWLNKTKINKLNEITHSKSSHVEEFETIIKQSEEEGRTKRLLELGDKRRKLTSQIPFEDMDTKTTQVKIPKKNIYFSRSLKWFNGIGLAFFTFNTGTRIYVFYFLNRDPGFSPVIKRISTLFSDSEKNDSNQLENNSNFSE